MLSWMRRTRRLECLLGLSLCLALAAVAQEKVPAPDANGEYRQRTSHTRWQVVDPDPHGLNGRLAKNFPDRFDDPRLAWPSTPVLSWPIVERFRNGQVLEAVTGNIGAILLIKEPSGKTWMMVRRSDGGVCFVRANQRFVRPSPR